jgi:hypothetical protein
MEETGDKVRHFSQPMVYVEYLVATNRDGGVVVSGSQDGFRVSLVTSPDAMHAQRLVLGLFISRSSIVAPPRSSGGARLSPDSIQLSTIGPRDRIFFNTTCDITASPVLPTPQQPPD